MTLLFNKASEKQKRRILRKNSTEAEKLVWSRLRKRQLAGVKFRRQYSIGAYVADFYCPEKKLAIEIDGAQHFEEDAMEYDRRREEYMASAGIKTIRFTNKDVFNNMEGVLQKITVTVEEQNS